VRTHPLRSCKPSCRVCAEIIFEPLTSAGRCPRCLRSDRTFRVDHSGLGPVRCVRCSAAFNPATASSTAALPADPSLAHPGDGEADVASVLDGGAGSAGRHGPASSTTDDEGAPASTRDALLTA
jgi:hypothetical protein